MVAYTWAMYETNVIKRIKTFTILSVAYKWLGGCTKVLAVDDQSELSLLKKLHKLLDEAEIVIAHNGDSFDIRKINARFIIHKLPPPSPYKTVDTKKIAKKVAYFDSNSLNNLGIDMGEGEKVKHRGFDMWEGCMAGLRKDWRDMRRYNKQDVDLLERIYLRLRPWATTHPRVSNENCPKCGSKNQHSRGERCIGKLRYNRLQCQDCGGWSKGSLSK